MSLRDRWKKTILVLAASLVLAGRAAAVAPEVEDEGKFFSPDAVKKANEQIRELARQYDKDLLVETYATVPADQVEKVKAMSREERIKFFHEWAADRIKTAVVNGVYVLICKEPPFFYVEVAGKGRTVFDPQFARKLESALREKLHEKQFDEALLDTVKLVREKLEGGKSK